jgi:hypothetical protein
LCGIQKPIFTNLLSLFVSFKGLYHPKGDKKMQKCISFSTIKQYNKILSLEYKYTHIPVFDQNIPNNQEVFLLAPSVLLNNQLTEQHFFDYLSVNEFGNSKHMFIQTIFLNRGFIRYDKYITMVQNYFSLNR